MLEAVRVSAALTPGIPSLTRDSRSGIVALIAQGQSNKEIARTLGITPETVKSHLKSIFTKLEVEKRAQAVSRAQALGLVKHS